MYVLVHHRIHDRDGFWPLAQEGVSKIPSGLTLHLSIPARDGTVATCLWEGESLEAVRGFVEPLLGKASDNDYSEAENREGIALPSQLSV